MTEYDHLRKLHHPFDAYANITATEQTATAACTVKGANYRVYVQRITLSITTHAAGKVFTVQSSNGTPKLIAHRADLAAAAGVPDVITWDFGPKGVPIALGESANWLWSTGGSGIVGVATISGYQKAEGAVLPSGV